MDYYIGAFWTVIVPVDVYCTECTGYVRSIGCQWHFRPYCDPGDFEYSGCDQHNTKYGCYTSVYQLRRYVDFVPDGRNGNCAQYIETDTCGRIVQKHSFQSLYNVLLYIKWFLILHIIEANDEHRRLREEMK